MNTQNKFVEKMDTLIAEFIDQIKNLCREGFCYDRKKNIQSSCFAMFDLEDDLYYKSKYQKEHLEWRVRDALINEGLDYLFKSYHHDIRWRMNSTLTTKSTTEAYEANFPAEFFIVKNGKYTAYRYTPFTADYSIPENLPDFTLIYHQTGVNFDTLEQWVAIDWSDSTYDASSITETPFQTTKTLKTLFVDYFSLEEYYVFTNKIYDAIARAKKILGFQTIPRLVNSNLSVFKQTVIHDIFDQNFLSMSYQIFEIDNENNLTKITTIPSKHIFSTVDASLINNCFFNNSLYLSLIGIEEFAQSFLTAEYLYKIFEIETSFDYTSVVSGYIKSVEQLCSKIVTDFIIPQYDDRLYYLCCPLNKAEINELKSKHALLHFNSKIYVKMDKGYEKYFFSKELNMGELFYFIHINAEHILKINPLISTVNKNESIMFECLKDYSKVCRNEYFHKKNIDDFRIAKCIRNNSLLIIYWLLGSIVLSPDTQINRKKLGIIDDSFDCLYKRIAYTNDYRYILKLRNCSEKKVIRIPSKNDEHFDKNGFLLNAELKFVEVDDYPKNYDEYWNFINELPDSTQYITINRQQLPEELFIIHSNDVKNKINYNI